MHRLTAIAVPGFILRAVHIKRAHPYFAHLHMCSTCIINEHCMRLFCALQTLLLLSYHNDGALVGLSLKGKRVGTWLP
jgi:hypothetical protein